MPLQMRIPKRGFNNVNRVAYIPLNLDRLQQMADKYNVTTFDMEWLMQHGIVGRQDSIKILGDGELNCAVQVTAHACSAAAKQAIEDKGGSVNLV